MTTKSLVEPLLDICWYKFEKCSGHVLWNDYYLKCGIHESRDVPMKVFFVFFAWRSVVMSHCFIHYLSLDHTAVIDLSKWFNVDLFAKYKPKCRICVMYPLGDGLMPNCLHNTNKCLQSAQWLNWHQLPVVSIWKMNLEIFNQHHRWIAIQFNLTWVVEKCHLSV